VAAKPLENRRVMDEELSDEEIQRLILQQLEEELNEKVES
jgi:hypothetical protein